jgi:hypothetical protein
LKGEDVAPRTTNIWGYRNPKWASIDLAGFEVEAVDGGIGKIDRASSEAGAGHVVVDTGPWIFGKKVLLPAGVIREIDLDSEKVFADRSKEDIKHAPEFRGDAQREGSYLDALGGYYRPRGNDRRL